MAETELKVLARSDLPLLASPLRRRIFDALDEPASATALARDLDMSRQRIGYHMRALARGGFIVPAGERARRGLTEKLYRARPITWVLDGGPEVPETASAALRERASWSALVALAARAVRELARLRTLAAAKRKRLATLSIDGEVAFADPAARKAFADELRKSIETLIARYHDDGGRRYRLLIGAYPRPPQQEETDDY